MKNASLLLDEYQRRAVHLESMPACLYVEGVNGCPGSCAMCRFIRTRPVPASRDLLERLEPYYSDFEVLGVHGSGEPLLGDLPYFVEQAERHDFVLHMNTTGSLLSAELARLLVRVRLSIRFSIHAGTPPTYRKIMGGDLDRVLANIARLVDLDQGRSDFWLSYLVMKENFDEIESFLNLARSVGVGRVRFMELNPNPQTLLGRRMPDRDFRFSYLEQAPSWLPGAFRDRLPAYRKLAAELGLQIEEGSMGERGQGTPRIPRLVNGFAGRISPRLAPFPLRPRAGACVAPWTGQVMVAQDGNVRLCCSCGLSLGNLQRSTLAEVWNGETAREVRTAFSRGHFPRACAYCRGLGFSEYPRNAFLAGLEA